MIRAVSSMIKFHLAALDIMSVGAQVKVEAEKMASPDILKAGVETWPHLLSFKVALQETRVVQEFLRQSRAPVTTPATLNQACQEADEEIMQWCAAAVDDAEDNATREGRPVGQDFTREETTSMMPIDVVDNDSEDEEARIRMHIQKDLDEAVEAGFSTVQDDEFEVIEKDIPEKGGWTEAEKTRPGILNPFDESEKPFTIIDDEGKEVARDEESNEPIGEEVTSAGSDVEVIEAKRAERPAAGSTEVSPPLMKICGQGTCGEKDASPKPKIDPVTITLEEATEKAEEAVWLDPQDLAARFPYKTTEYGRPNLLSRKLTYLLRGHALAWGKKSPDFNAAELSADWEQTKNILRERSPASKLEILQVIRSSDSRRFQVKVTRVERCNLERFAVEAYCTESVPGPQHCWTWRSSARSSPWIPTSKLSTWTSLSGSHV